MRPRERARGSDHRRGVRFLPPLIGLLIAVGSAVLGAGLPASPAAADAADAIRRLRCIACHKGENMHTSGVRRDSSRGGTINLEDFRGADHGKIHCLDCHSKGFDNFPHLRKKTETCMDCHPRKEAGAAADKPYEFARILKEYEGTVHFTEYRHAKEKCCGTAPLSETVASETVTSEATAAPAGADEPDTGKPAAQRFTCEHCHEPHYFKATRRIGEPTLIRANDNGPCLRCHQDAAAGPLADPAERGLLAAHSYLPYAELHLEGTRCIDCHTSVTTRVAHDLPTGEGANQGCNTCHSIDSVLTARLYRYVENVGSLLGFANPRVLQDGYVMGANRHRGTDLAAYLLMSLALALVLAHGVWRLLARWRAAPRQPEQAAGGG